MAQRKSQESPQVEAHQFTIAEIERGIEKFRLRIEEVRALEDNSVAFDSAHRKNAESNFVRTVREVFGANSPECKEHRYHSIWHGRHNVYDTSMHKQAKFREGISQSIIVIEGLISRLEEKRVDALAIPPQHRPLSRPVMGSRRVFVVHGHDDGSLQTVARFLERLGLDPVILHEQANKGRTLIEKLEGHDDVGFAVVLLTPDDIGYPSNSPDQEKPRARQNVIFELGYFIARLGRENVCALRKGSVEILSDYEGVIYISMEGTEKWQTLLSREIKAAGISFDFNPTL